MKLLNKGLYIDKKTGIEVERCVHEKDNDYGDKAGDVYYIVNHAGNHSNPYYSLPEAKRAANAMIRQLSPMINGEKRREGND